MEKQELKTEWCLLQNQFDCYEKHSLYIKLLSVIVLVAAEISDVITLFIVMLLMVLWLQDAIWKTFQSRIETRLLQVEKYIAEQSEERAFQFNSDYQRIRLNGLSLVNEYALQSIRPTVAFPHIVLILVVLVQYVLY
ncbi:MAG: hypothetical protein OQL27_04660 [Sedimenticola sp.]|nr:hypothetical protein [Sedimenticola sp.]